MKFIRIAFCLSGLLPAFNASAMTGKRITGIVLTSVGGGAVLLSLAAFTGDGCDSGSQSASEEEDCENNASTNRLVGVLAGGAMLGVGVPLLIWGADRSSSADNNAPVNRESNRLFFSYTDKRPALSLSLNF